MPDDRRRVAPLTISLVASLILVGAGACQSGDFRGSRPLGASMGAMGASAEATTAAPSSDRGIVGLRAALATLDENTLELHQHITTLADPFFEGRSADTRGNQLAAEYLEFHFSRLGLVPAFAAESEPTWFQPFTVPGSVVVDQASASCTSDQSADSFELGTDFNPAGLSGSGAVEGPAVFVGYSIAGGDGNYSNYADEDDLTGKVAVMFRYEPMTGAGTSKWAPTGGGRWSRHAGLIEKIGAAASRGAAAIVIINPPGAADPASRELESPNRTRLTAPVGVPVIMMTSGAGNRLLKLADAQGRDAMEFRRLADAGTRPVSLDAPGAALDVRVELHRERLATNNVGAILPGKGRLADQYVVIGAHYDHVGYGYVGGASPSNQGTLHPGADDNASGVAALLVLPKLLSQRYEALPDDANARSVLFLAFSAEEMGLLGSEHFVNNAPVSSSAIYAMINLDMIGRLGDQGLEIGGVGTAESFEDLLTPAIQRSGLKVNTTASGIGPSDHASFHRAGTSVLFFFTGTHADYHRPGDLAHKVNFEGASRIVSLVEDIALLLSTRPEALVFKQTSGSRPGGARSNAKVRLGIMPGDYSGEEPGILVGDVFEGTSAALGGMQKGDRMIRWDGQNLAGVADMMGFLQKHEPGDVARITVVRDGQEVTLPVTLQAPDRGR